MKRFVFPLVLLSFLGACSDMVPTPVEPEDDSMPAQSAKSEKELQEHKVSICHVDGKSQYRPISISTSAIPAHIAHGDSPLVGSWSGRWYWWCPSTPPMDVQFRDDCGGFEEGAYLADVDYWGGCLGTWTFTQFTPAGVEIWEDITEGTCPDVSLWLTYDVESGELRIDVPPEHQPQHGLVTRTQ